MHQKPNAYTNIYEYNKITLRYWVKIIKLCYVQSTRIYISNFNSLATIVLEIDAIKR